MKVIRTITVSLLSVSLLAGCAKAPPKCSDEETFSLVRQIVADQFWGGRAGMSEEYLQENMRFDLARASAFDADIKKYSCEATLIAGETIKLPLTYESQLDDKNQHIVFVSGILPRDLLLVQTAVKSKFLKEQAGAMAEASSATAVTAAAPAAPDSPVSGDEGEGGNDAGADDSDLALQQGCVQAAELLNRSGKVNINTNDLAPLVTWRASCAETPPTGEGNIMALCEGTSVGADGNGELLFFWSRTNRGKVETGYMACPQ
ncbi:MAG: hypothetical protein V4729_04480 [Pseudomonadota bacterium]